MKRSFLIVTILMLILLTSCVKEKLTTDELPEAIELTQLKGVYHLEDYREFGKWLLYFDEDVLTDKLKRASTYSLLIDEERFVLTRNPFNPSLWRCTLPAELTMMSITDGELAAGVVESSSQKRDGPALSIEKVWIRRGEQNGTELFELTLDTYLDMKIAPTAFVYVNGDVDGVLNRPEFVKNNEENAYTLKRYRDARQVTGNQSVDAAFQFLKGRDNHEEMLSFEDPNRVDAAGVVGEPDRRDRLRELGNEGIITDGCTYTYDIRDNQTDSIFVDLKQSNLPTQADRDCDIYKLQIKEATICTFHETGTVGIFTGLVQYATTSNTELIKNARFMPSISNPFNGGDGSEGDPFQIHTAEQLNAIRGDYLGTSGGTKYYFKQTADIDLSTYSDWDPITPFYGAYDGDLFVISNLQITGNMHIKGLFGFVKNSTLTNIVLSSAAVSGSQSLGVLAGNTSDTVVSTCSATGTINGSGNNVGGLIGLGGYPTTITSCSFDGTVTGASYVGGLAGQTNGSIKQSWSSGTVTGTGNIIGGFIGYNGGFGHVQNSYSTASAAGGTEVGGFIGRTTDGHLNNCYAAGKVSGTSVLGGFVGNNTKTNNIFNCYWDTQTTEQNASDGGTGLTSENMRKSASFNSWGFGTIWTINENISYPWLMGNPQNPTPGGIFAGGDGSEGNPYEVQTLDHLNNVRNYRGQVKFFKQIADIDMSSETDWVPLGAYNDEFTSSYDGNCYKISNLSINKPTESAMSLFGEMDSNATLTNITMENVDIIGKDYVAGLVGFNGAGAIINCHVQGKIQANLAGQCYAGLLAGRASGAKIERCSVDGQVTGSQKIGGLIGEIYSTVFIKLTYATATVNGDDLVGGFVGYSAGCDIEDSHCRGSVSCTAGNYAGGFVGYNISTSTIKRCYSMTKVADVGTSEGFCPHNDTSSSITDCFWETTGNIAEQGERNGTGKSTVEMKQQGTYTNWTFSGIWSIDGTKNDGYPYLTDNNDF